MLLRRIPTSLLLAAALPLAGCEMLTGDKAKDGESVGYACRVSNRSPEDCMKENSDYTPTSILEGWKAADKDVKEKKVDLHPAKPKPPAEGEGEGAKGEEAAKPEGEQAAEAKPAETKPAEAKPAAEPAKH